MDLMPQEWFHMLRQEYLQRFIGQGGSSVKFVVTDSDADRADVQSRLTALAQQEEYLCVPVDAKETKIHMMDKFFHQVARRISWAGVTICASYRRYYLPKGGILYDWIV